MKFISLVDRPANQRDIIWKSRDEVLIPISKVDTEQRMVYGVVYSPESPDTDGDWADAETIKTAAHGFMKAGQTGNIDKQHDFVAGQGYIAESWILRSPDPLFPDENEGAWCVGIYVNDNETWDLVKSGDIGGISLAGFAHREEPKTQKTEKSMRLFQWIKEKFTTKGVAESYNTRQVTELTWALMDSFQNIFNDEKITDKKAAIKEDVSEFLSILDDVTTKAISEAVELNKQETKQGESMNKDIENQNLTPEPEVEESKDMEKAAESEKADEVMDMLAGLKKSIDEISDRLEVVEKTPNPKLSDELDGVNKEAARQVWC